MNKFIIEKNEYLNNNVKAFYNTDYLRMKNPGNPNYLNKLKNTYNSFNDDELDKALHTTTNILFHDIYDIYNQLQIKELTICVIPRSKTNLEKTQLYFLEAVKIAIGNICYEYNELDNLIEDGTDYIKRHTNTYTTHLGDKTPNYTNDGSKPYPGITKDTCHISSKVKGKHILLIDDIYTKNVNIDEDAIQALLDNGAASVTFYAVAKTTSR